MVYNIICRGWLHLPRFLIALLINVYTFFIIPLFLMTYLIMILMTYLIMILMTYLIHFNDLPYDFNDLPFNDSNDLPYDLNLNNINHWLASQ